MNKPFIDRVYFNEWNEYCYRWLCNLFSNDYDDDVINYMDVTIDWRDICDVEPVELMGYTRVHLFAGIGGWELALNLAGWPVDEEVWTGSCPCQPFSNCGKRESTNDERHLWPEMFRLIKRCKPTVVFGEQVAGQLGLEWFDGIRTDLANIGYHCGMAVLPAACVGSPQERERIFWVADSAWSSRQRPVRRSDQRMDGRVTGKEWRDYRSISCRDGKVRRVGTGVQPLAARVPGDVERLLAYGNSIVPQVGAVFIHSYMQAAGIGVD